MAGYRPREEALGGHTVARVTAELAAVAMRNVENAAADLNRENNYLLSRNYDDEIAKLWTRIDNAPRLRVGPAICGGPTSAEPAGGASGCDAAISVARWCQIILTEIFSR